MNNKILWLVIFVLLVGGGVYVAKNSDSVVVPVTTQTSMKDTTTATPVVEKPISTIPAGWRTFENKENNISISFPSAFKAQDGKEDFVGHTNDGITLANQETFRFCNGKDVPPQAKNWGGKTCSGEEHIFTIGLGTGGLVDEKMIIGWGETDKHMQVTVNGKKVWLIHWGVGGPSTSIYFERSGKNISFHSFDYPPQSLYSDIENTQTTSLEEQILSTLKF